MDVITHYDLLIDENNDPFRDPPELQAYMSRWDGEPFLTALTLDKHHRVLEIGIGTGRIAAKVAPCCLQLTGIDLSPKTIMRARENLTAHHNITYVCDDFMTHAFHEAFDVIYSSLTMMHIREKAQAIARVSDLLTEHGRFCLSIDKSQSRWIDMGSRRLEIYPDQPEHIVSLMRAASLNVTGVLETEFAYIIVGQK